MSYKLAIPFTDDERSDFIVEHNHNNGLRIVEANDSIYALEEYEELQNGEVINVSQSQEYLKKKLAEAKELKLQENEIARNVEYITTSLGKLKTETPLGDLKNAIFLYEKLVADEGKIPANMVRLYDSGGNVSGNPELSIDEFSDLLLEVAKAYVVIDVKSTKYVMAINNAMTIEELNSIVFDY